ncbi:serine protease [Shewanella colwelliana]|uniref:Serine protease n=1 Tax=Shewanella colwelliana TaxID=23 RepID=A0ABQ4NZ44_SHECO|nr:S8 family serine peptidase [Shewanella colwelliana]GIU24893.1 serine protease [Shewanella colwelliana]GIU40323.1 serine protease [Shewanella colwelliana]
MKKTQLASAITLTLLSSSLLANETPATYGGESELNGVHNRCIVRLKDNTDSSTVQGIAHKKLTKANQLSGKSASLKHLYINSIKGFTITMPCAAASKAFGQDNDVASLTPDSIISVSRGKPNRGGNDSVAQSTPWSVTRVGGPLDGSGSTAWVIDTGIDLSHKDLNVDQSRGFSAFSDKRNRSFNDGHGHGTHVAGTIAAKNNTIDVVGVAAGATVVPVKVLDSRGSGSTSGVIAGVDHVGANAQAGDCANMSLGGGVSTVLDDAVKAAALKSGAFFVLAAGNDGDNANNHSPARANGSNVFTISAVNSSDNMPSWSNFGNPPVDYAAPGVSILSLKRGGGTTTMSGTSMAAPAACAVLMLSNGTPSTSGVAGNDQDGNPDPIISL